MVDDEEESDDERKERGRKRVVRERKGNGEGWIEGKMRVEERGGVQVVE